MDVRFGYVGRLTAVSCPGGNHRPHGVEICIVEWRGATPVVRVIPFEGLGQLWGAHARPSRTQAAPEAPSPPFRIDRASQRVGVTGYCAYRTGAALCAFRCP